MDAAQILAANGLVNQTAIVNAASAAGLPLNIAAALCEKESGGWNVYGHDAGGAMYGAGEVTQANFTQQFLPAVLGGAASNGVGPVQITYPGYFRQQPDYPWWDPYFNCLKGFQILAADLAGDYSNTSIARVGARYNGGNSPGPKAIVYGDDLAVKARVWQTRLDATSTGGSMTKVFLSPSDQDNNAVSGGGNEQQYAQLRCARAAEVLRAHGVTVKVSETGIGDDSNGYVASVNEGEAWGPDLYVADHTNATGNPSVVRSGVQAYCWLGDPDSKRLGECINARMDPIVPGGASIQDGSNLYEVSGPSMTAVLMESGYHDNPVDAEVIRTKTREMGQAIAYGILDYLGIPVNDTITSPEEDDMPSAQEIAQAVWEQPVDVGREDGTTQTEKAGLWAGWGNIHALTASERAEQILTKQDALDVKLDAIAARLDQVTSITSEGSAIDPAKLASVTSATNDLQSAVSALSAALAGLTN